MPWWELLSSLGNEMQAGSYLRIMCSLLDSWYDELPLRTGVLWATLQFICIPCRAPILRPWTFHLLRRLSMMPTTFIWTQRTSKSYQIYGHPLRSTFSRGYGWTLLSFMTRASRTSLKHRKRRLMSSDWRCAVWLIMRSTDVTGKPGLVAWCNYVARGTDNVA